MWVFDIHNLVTDIVSGFDKVYQRMAYILQRMVTELADSQFPGYLPENVFFTLEKTVFESFGIGFCRFEGVFDDRSQGGIGHGIASRAASVEAVGQETEGIGITFEMA